MRARILILTMVLFLSMVSCTITGRVTPTPRPTRSATRTPLPAVPAIALPTAPSLPLTVPALPTVALTIPALPTGRVTLPAVPTGLIPAVGTLLPGLLGTPTPTATPTR
jgi:hypothetical protein